jgi:16S rRNA A1518/A1519 N6-dimethyltransferase RsmA/KsgA/DIM1 with predicted DNA glycosylase/AP lyase activity
MSNFRGQNFLRNRRVVNRLVGLSGGNPDILLVDLGAGTGTISGRAIQQGRNVLAIESDPRLVNWLFMIYRG